MFLHGLMLVIFTLSDVTISSHLEDKIDPVELKYYCIKLETSEENQDKSSVLLIHGLTGSHKHWDGINQIIALRTKRRVCTVDLRNHGDSPWSNRTDIAALAVDIGYFLDQQNIKKVNIIGQSLGGKVAIHYALNNPYRVDSIVVEDMRPNSIAQPAVASVLYFMSLLESAIKNIPEGADEEEAKIIMLKFMNEGFEKAGNPMRLDESFPILAEMKLVDRKWQYKFNLKGLMEFSNVEATYTLSKGLYEGPTLFIYGTKSVFDIPGDKDNILKLFPNAVLFPIEGAGHDVHQKFRREFEDAVIKFLNGLE